jgi:zinc protease
MPMRAPSFPLLLGAFMTVAVALPRAAEAVTIQEVTSPAGITAWLVEDYTVPIVSMNFAFRGGASQDPDGKAGLANLMSGLLDEGAGPLDSRAFQARLEDLNVSLSFDAGADAFYGNFRALAQNRDEAFELVRLSVNEPRFDEEAVTRIRGQVTAGLRRAETDPNELASKVWAKTMFGSHPYGRASEGTLESVAALTADDLRGFAGRTLARDNLHVVVVGAISADDTKSALDLIFGGLPEKSDLVPVAETEPAIGQVVHEDLAVPQSAIRLGGPGLKRQDPDFIPAYVADHILGGGVFSSRLYTAVREERGLAYSVGTSLYPYDHAGAFVAATSTDANKAGTALSIMLDEIKRFGEEGPTEKELAEAKDYLVGNFALRFDSSQKIARNLLGFQLDGLGIDYITRRNDLVRGVALEDVNRVARKLFTKPLTVVTVGPAAS